MVLRAERRRDRAARLHLGNLGKQRVVEGVHAQAEPSSLRHYVLHQQHVKHVGQKI